MEKFFGTIEEGHPFEMFSLPHLASLAVIFLVILTIYIFRKQLREEGKNRNIRYLLGGTLLLQQLLYYYWHIYNGTYDLKTALPLNLCGASIVLCIILMFSKSYSIFEVVYFWGLGGTLQALLTPDIQGGYSFPHFRFFQFFTGHGLIVVTILFMVFVNHYRPTIKSVLRTFLITNLFLVFVGGVNWLTGANYLYICNKPESASLLDFLGPWPWYILSLEGIAVILFILLYLPYFISDRKKAQKLKKEEGIVL